MTVAQAFAARLHDELGFPGVEQETGFRLLEVRPIGDHVVVIGRTLGAGITVGFAVHAPSFVALFSGYVEVAASAFASELREPGGCGEPPPPHVAAELQARYPGCRWITPVQSLHSVLTEGR